ncbi:MAG: transposase [Chroococcidiopsidaceae cyanobacterium CP_BM_ER_R8_30]|nr:transposase [Chroococcidiopsidaceae cyanobacterium CP_BM_ER_R8_30]
MKAYSIDLRQKIIDAYNRQEGSQRQLAKRFSVSVSFVQDLLKRYREDGKIAPREHGGGAKAKLNLEQVLLVKQLVEEDNDAILVELCERLEQHSGVRISRATMGRLTQKLQLTRKKSRSMPVNEILNECNGYGLSIGTPLERSDSPIWCSSMRQG